MSGDRWGELSRLVVACAVDRPERADDLDLDLADVASGPARDLLLLIRDRRSRGLAAGEAALCHLPELDRIGGAGFLADLLDAPVSQYDFQGYLAEMRQEAARDGLRRQVEADTLDAARVRVLADRLDGPGGHRKVRLRRLDVGVMVTTVPPPVPWIVEDVLVRGCLTLLAGREGAGKSLLSLALGAGVLRGDESSPFPARPGRVLLIDAENGDGELHRRVRALGLDTEAGARLSAYITEAPDLLNALAEVENAIARERPDVVILDSLRSLWAGKENASEEVGPVLDALRNLARRADVAILLLHHAGKLSGEYRGSTAIGAGAQIVVNLGREPDDPARDRFYLTCAKMRPARPWPRRWIRLAVECDALVCLEEAEPPDGTTPPPQAPARTEIAPQVAAVLDRATEPMTTAALCREVGRAPKDGTVRRVLDHLAAAGFCSREADGWRRVPSAASPRGGGTLAPPSPRPENAHANGDAEGANQLGTLTGAGTPEPADLSAHRHDAAPTPDCGGCGSWACSTCRPSVPVVS